jgi:hypothetical protein
MPPEDHPCSTTSGRDSNRFGAFPLTTNGIAADTVTPSIGGTTAPAAGPRQGVGFRTGCPE